MTSSQQPSAAVSIVVVVLAVVLAALPAALAAVLGQAFALTSLLPAGIGWSTVGAAVVALLAVVGVGARRLPLWALAAVWLPPLIAVALADGLLQDAALTTTTMADAMTRPVAFTAFVIEGLALTGTGALLTAGLGLATALVCRRHPERIGAILVSEASIAVGVGLGLMDFGQALQLDGLNGSGAYLEGARLGQNLCRAAPMLGVAMLVSALVTVGKALKSGARDGLVPGTALAAGGVAVVVGSFAVGTTMGHGITAFPGLSPPDDVTALEVPAGQRPRGPFRAVCTSDGVRGTASPMLLDARADSAAVQRCLAAFAAAGASEVELMARRAVVDVVDFDLAAFTDAPRYAAVVIGRCVDGGAGTPFSAETDLARVFDGDPVCFGPNG
jgi:hypothetical protein